MEKTVEASSLGHRLDEILNDIRGQGTCYIIEHGDESAAVVVPLAVYEQWKQDHEETAAVPEQPADEDAPTSEPRTTHYYLRGRANKVFRTPGAGEHADLVREAERGYRSMMRESYDDCITLAHLVVVRDDEPTLYSLLRGVSGDFRGAYLQGTMEYTDRYGWQASYKYIDPMVDIYSRLRPASVADEAMRGFIEAPDRARPYLDHLLENVMLAQKALGWKWECRLLLWEDFGDDWVETWGFRPAEQESCPILYVADDDRSHSLGFYCGSDSAWDEAFVMDDGNMTLLPPEAAVNRWLEESIAREQAAMDGNS